MKRNCAFLILLAAPLAAEIVDRVAVTVGLQAITEGAIRRHLQFGAWLDEKAPDLSPESRRKAADRLVEQFLLRREVGLSLFPMTAAAEVEERLEQIRKDRRMDDKAFRASIESSGLSMEDLTEEIRWQITLLNFLDFRFRPSIQITEEDIQKYYENEFAKLLREQTPDAKLPPLDEVRTAITSLLQNREVDRTLDSWLALAKTQVRIRYRAGASQ